MNFWLYSTADNPNPLSHMDFLPSSGGLKTNNNQSQCIPVQTILQMKRFKAAFQQSNSKQCIAMHSPLTTSLVFLNMPHFT